ncbi:MAG: hypothetical protein IPJ32_14360 [Sphingobacteriaceae bacterium]|nr:hypothetical protein [Sphingobacteriaceae bacterium]
MSAKKELSPVIKAGAAKVYRKNLQRILDSLSQTNHIIQKTQFQNYLIQGEDCLVKLKKAESDAYNFDLENEYNYYKELFLRAST